MFKLSKNYDVSSYKKFLGSLLIDKEIKEEILNQIDIFYEDGKIIFDGNNLYGKIISKKANEYLEIRYENGYFVCNYTKWNGKKIVNITQIDLKNNNVKMDRKEKTEYVCPYNKNETKIEELEKIYDSENKLIYKSSLEKSVHYDSLESSIIYKDDSFYSNNFRLEQDWYISNGSIIKYQLSKHYLHEQSELNESYSICPESYSDGFGNYYYFTALDENLFKAFMLGQITIEQLLEQNKKNKEEMKKVK